MNASFERLIQRQGAYSLPYLIHLSGMALSNEVNLYFVNSDKSVLYDGHLYRAAAFRYSPAKSEHGFTGGGSLSISCAEQGVLELCDSSPSMNLEVKAVIDTEGNITPIKTFTHSFGKVSVGRETIEFSFDPDDRLTMTFPTLIWSAQNNRGNS